MQIRGGSKIVPTAAGVLLGAAGIAVLYKADVLTVRLMQATGADVLSADPEYLPPILEAPGAAQETVQRLTHWSLPVHAFGLGLIGVGLWLQVRTFRRRSQPALDEQIQHLLAHWVLMRAALRHRLAPGITPSWQDRLSLKVLDYLVARYKDPGSVLAVPPSHRSTPSAVPPPPALLRPHHANRKPPRGPAAFRPALGEIRRLNIESYADFGFSLRFQQNANYN